VPAPAMGPTLMALVRDSLERAGYYSGSSAAGPTIPISGAAGGEPASGSSIELS
jgi:hypothetical protein